MTEEADRTPAVPLEQYATVRAGLADGLSVEELLAFEGLDPATWRQAEVTWREALLTPDAERGLALSMQLDALMSEARKHWTRRIPPLDADLQAWLDFVRAWSSSPDPVGLLAELSLGGADVAWLHRFWSGRLADDPGLQKQALAILAEPPGELAKPAPEPARIITRREGRRTDDDPDATRLPVAGAAARPVPFIEAEAKAPLPPLSAPLPRAPRPARKGTTSVDETAFLATLPDNETLPFLPALRDDELEPDTSQSAAAPAAAAPAFAPPPALFPPLPVVAREPPARVELGSVGSGAERASDAQHDGMPSNGHETVFLRVYKDTEPLPFGPPIRARTPATGSDLDETLPPIVAAVPPLPFDSAKASPEDALARAHHHAGAAQGPRASSREAVDETVPVRTQPEEAVLPFGAPRRDDAGETAAVPILRDEPVLPFSAAPARAPAAPVLTLEQYASLCVDLALQPDGADDTITRYGLTDDARRAEDAAWRVRLGIDPEQLERFQHAAAVYRAWREKVRRGAP
jgi:hypothetical protein